MRTHNHHPQRPKNKRKAFWLVGLGSILWLLFRSGNNPRRLAYPCQRAALASSLGFLGYLASVLGATQLYRHFKRHVTLPTAGTFILALLFTVLLGGSHIPAPPVYAALTLPGWTSPSAISNVFVVSEVPVSECSLEGGALPGTAPCNEASYALHDAGIDALIEEMERQGDYFFKTASQSDGIVGSGDVVVIKINNQWGGFGAGNMRGRFSTNTDIAKGLLWRILQHPEGFNGEIVIAENTQWNLMDWDFTPANAQDQDQSFQDVVNAFRNLGYPVSLYLWDDLNESLIRGGDVNAGDYPAGEYANGDTSDAYILLEDAAGTGTDELSYPKFRTAGGNTVSMRYGVWDGSSYDSDRLTFINLPILKMHGMAGATIAWKNLIGFVTIADTDRRYGDWDDMHDFFWGYTEGTNRSYGLIGRTLALIRAPDLNIVDAIWIATEDNTGGPAVRQNVLLASTDPFAVDWYASEYVLRPVSTWPEGASAARGGIFRNATRTNQNAAASLWPGGNYPYIDLLDNFDGDTPSEDERSQLNVYHPGGVIPDSSGPDDTQPTEQPPPDTDLTPETTQPEAPVVPSSAGEMLEDFETGAETWSAYDDDAGSAVTCNADAGIVHEGGTALRVEFDIASDGWGGCDRYYDEIQNWEPSAGLSLWLRFENIEPAITLLLFTGDPESATPFEVNVPPTGESVGSWEQYTFLWADFALAEWADEGGLSEIDLTQIVSYGFSFGENEGQNTFWVDDIRLLGGQAEQPPDEAAPTEPTAPTPLAEADSPSDSSESGEDESGGGLPCGSVVLAPVGAVLLVLARERKKHKDA